MKCFLFIVCTIIRFCILDLLVVRAHADIRIAYANLALLETQRKLAEDEKNWLSYSFTHHLTFSICYFTYYYIYVLHGTLPLHVSKFAIKHRAVAATADTHTHTVTADIHTHTATADTHTHTGCHSRFAAAGLYCIANVEICRGRLVRKM